MCIRAPVFIINSRFTQHNKPEKVDAILYICKTQLHIKLKCRDLMLVAHLVEQVACVKAESLMQRPGFESSLGPVLHVESGKHRKQLLCFVAKIFINIIKPS